MLPEKKPNCNPEVLEKLRKDNVLVQIVKYTQKQGSTKHEDRKTTVTKVKLQDQYITGCVVVKDVYSVTTLDGKHYRGKI